MNKWLIAGLAGIAACGIARAQSLNSLDASTVTTGGTAITAINAGHRTKGGWLNNPSTATTPLCINEKGTATTTPGGDVTCIVPGQTYVLAANGQAVSVVSSDSAHKFSGYGWY